MADTRSLHLDKRFLWHGLGSSAGSDGPALGVTHRRIVASWAAALLAALVIAIALLQLVPPLIQHDPAAYVASANDIRSHGLFGEWYRMDLRTYGYPLFLAAAIAVGDTVGVG